MGGVPVKHHTHGKVGRRRSHHALKPIRINVCPNCQGPVLLHYSCKQCGLYAKKTKVKPTSPTTPVSKKSKKGLSATAIQPIVGASASPAHSAPASEPTEKSKTKD